LKIPNKISLFLKTTNLSILEFDWLFTTKELVFIGQKKNNMNPLHCLSFFWLMLVLCYGAPTNINIKDESDETIKLLESKDLAVVKFYSDSCVHCKTTSGSFLEASKKIKESNPNITILEVNTDNNHKLAERDGVQMIPVILFYKKGVKVGEFDTVNIMDPESIARWALQNAQQDNGTVKI